MGRFLDALGIEHENGLIKEDDVKPDPAKLAPAVAALAREFPADDVRLYLTTLLCQDPETWGGLNGIVEGLRQRLEVRGWRLGWNRICEPEPDLQPLTSNL